MLSNVITSGIPSEIACSKPRNAKGGLNASYGWILDLFEV